MTCQFGAYFYFETLLIVFSDIFQKPLLLFEPLLRWHTHTPEPKKWTLALPIAHSEFQTNRKMPTEDQSNATQWWKWRVRTAGRETLWKVQGQTGVRKGISWKAAARLVRLTLSKRNHYWNKPVVEWWVFIESFFFLSFNCTLDYVTAYLTCWSS